MKTSLRFGALMCAFISSFVLLPSAFPQGSLTPPGAPAPTMKTLDQVEPRTPIDATHTPGDADSLFKITQSGSYYLTGNVTGVASKHAIQIEASNVTLDLGGFRILSAGLDGINVSGAQSNITIKNGSVRTSADDGIDAASADTVRIHDITSRNNTGDGIVVGPDSMVLNCIVAHNTGNGINTTDNCTLENCISRENGGVGLDVDANSLVANCTARENGGIGISTDSNCTVRDSSFLLNGSHGLSAGLGNVINNCTARQNVGSGIFTSTSAVVRSCVARFNNTHGINVADESSVLESAATSNGGDGILAGDSVSVLNCNASSNSSHGIEGVNYSMVAKCTTIGNTGDGIRVQGFSKVTENSSSNNNNSNDAAGVHVTASYCVVEGNKVSFGNRGIKVDGPFNLIIRNHADLNGIDFVIVANNRVGVIVAAPASGAISGSNGGAAGMGTTDPTANITF